MLLPVFFLLGFSIAIIASVSPENTGTHLFYILISLVFFLFFSFLDLDILFPMGPVICVSSILFLLLPFLVGTVTRGSIRWIPIGNFTVQPSELVKPFLALFSAWYWSKENFSFKRFFNYLLMFLPIIVLIFIQPDLGSTLVVLSIFIGSILFSKISFKQFLVLVLPALLLIPLFWFLLHDYQRMRMVHFLKPYSDPLGEGYNLIQSKIAVGSGGFLGRGLGRGTQSHLAFLPERYTDFIFASLAEELGFIGSLAVVVLYLILFLRILKIAFLAKERQYFLLTITLFFYLFFQTVVNIGMNIGFMPITGITLPFISYGGSSLLTTMISLGILENVSRRNSPDSFLEIK